MRYNHDNDFEEDNVYTPWMIVNHYVATMWPLLKYSYTETSLSVREFQRNYRILMFNKYIDRDRL